MGKTKRPITSFDQLKTNDVIHYTVAEHPYPCRIRSFHTHDGVHRDGMEVIVEPSDSKAAGVVFSIGHALLFNVSMHYATLTMNLREFAAKDRHERL